MSKHSNAEPLRCSFCRKAEGAVSKLLSNPGDYPRAYICDECVAVCAAIIEDDRPEETADEAPHPLLSHPLASDLMSCVAEWIRQESLGTDASEELARVRAVAARMMSDG